LNTIEFGILPYREDSERPELGSACRSPLTEIGVNAKEGEYILTVDGKPTNQMTDIYESLVNTVGKQVKLKLNAEPKDAGAHETTVIPTGSEQPLYYYNWVQSNIEKVSQGNGRKIGYVMCRIWEYRVLMNL